MNARPGRKPGRGFSLLETVCVLAAICVMAGAGLGLLGDPGNRAAREAADHLEAGLESARTTALASRETIALAVESPEKDGEGIRTAVLRLDAWREGNGGVEAERISRWRALPRGVVLPEAGVEGWRNALDQPGTLVSLRSERGGPSQVRCRLLVFSPRGGLKFPAGSDPLLLRIQHAGKPERETRLGIGRIVARTWRVGE